MRYLFTTFAIAAIIVAGVYAFRGVGSKQIGQGIPANPRITDIGQILDHAQTWQGKEVTVRGEITQKCPTTGCWFYLKDATDTIRVDTAPSGFTVTEVPVRKTVTVHGKVTTAEGGDAELVAVGMKS